MDKGFKYLTVGIVACLLLSVLLHILLYTSDSEAYRNWVTVQIGLQLIGVVSLVFVLRHSLSALITFAVITISFTVINTIYVNYGNVLLNIVAFIMFWALYGYFISKTWKGNNNNVGESNDRFA